MARIRKVTISNFRGIKRLSWLPSEGINCLLGPGDSGKSSVIDAIDKCLIARRNTQFTDADFNSLNVQEEISIEVTIGELEDELLNLDIYGKYLRGFDASTSSIDDEPASDTETVLTLKLTVGSDLDPSWSLVSERADAQGESRFLTWEDRRRLAPTRVGATAAYHLGWRRGSVLNRLSSEQADYSLVLAESARKARATFGDAAQNQLSATLGVVEETARNLGIPLGTGLKAMLDAQSVSLSGGTISLHDTDGVPLAGLGSGSIRLLITGLQREAAGLSKITLIDEVEHGLEPHRIIRLLGSLGSKADDHPLQVFMATHSPVVVRELSGSQLFVIRPTAANHEILPVGTSNNIQGTVRLYPEAFLASSVIVCEGASEVGLLRGLDEYRASSGHDSLNAMGTALVDCGGGDANRIFNRAAAFQRLGYHAAVVRDADLTPTVKVASDFVNGGGKIVAWRNGRALEDELFLSLSCDAVAELISRAIELQGKQVIDSHIRSSTDNGMNLQSILAERDSGSFAAESRNALGRAARKKPGWFKTLSFMEDIGREIVGPDLAGSNDGLASLIDSIFTWAISRETQDQTSVN